MDEAENSSSLSPSLKDPAYETRDSDGDGE